MMAAISAASKGDETLLLEKNEKLGKKLFITGKGRCNVTNACDVTDFFDSVCSNPKFLYFAGHFVFAILLPHYKLKTYSNTIFAVNGKL